MSDQGQDTSFFTHRLLVATPEGFGPETAASIDRYVLAQMGRRWSGPFARLRSGVYLMRLEENNASDAYQLVLIIAIALFGRISTPAAILEPLAEAGEPSLEPIRLEPASAERLTRTLANFAQLENGPGAGNAADKATLDAIETAIRETNTQVAEMRGDVGQVAEKIAELSQQPSEAPVAETPDEEKPFFKIAKSGAVAFSTSMKSMSRRVEDAVNALTDAVQRIDAAAPEESVDAQRAGGPSEDTMRGLAENLAELARGQARLAQALEERGDAVVPAAAPASIEIPEGGVEAMIGGLVERIEANENAARALVQAVGEAASNAETDLAALFGQMTDLAEESRGAAEQMLDVAVAWRRSVEDGDEAVGVSAEAEETDVEVGAEEGAEEDADAFGEAIAEAADDELEKSA